MELWSLFQEQILGMRWLNELIGGGLSAVGLNIESRIGGYPWTARRQCTVFPV